MNDSPTSMEAPEIIVPEGLGLEPERLLDLYWYMLLSRILDERGWRPPRAPVAAASRCQTVSGSVGSPC